VFILAHPDDEIAFAPLIDRLVREGKRVRLAFLTDGRSGGPPAVRKGETIRALASIGIDHSDLLFGAIHDGQLYRNLRGALEAVDKWCGSLRSIARIYTLAWEGGHPDHDAAHIVAAVFAAGRGLADRVRQVAFYRASDRWPAPLFTVSSPLPANGPVDSIALSSSERWLPVRLIRFYRSQWRSFAGLAPFMLWHAITRRTLELQPLNPRRLSERPTFGPLLYEVRNGVSGEDFLVEAASFLARPADDRKQNRLAVATQDVRTA
jgi:LmbE family N-acetylglucosaminyl deacetylase